MYKNQKYANPVQWLVTPGLTYVRYQYGHGIQESEMNIAYGDWFARNHFIKFVSGLNICRIRNKGTHILSASLFLWLRVRRWWHLLSITYPCTIPISTVPFQMQHFSELQVFHSLHHTCNTTPWHVNSGDVVIPYHTNTTWLLVDGPKNLFPTRYSW